MAKAFIELKIKDIIYAKESQLKNKFVVIGLEIILKSKALK